MTSNGERSMLTQLEWTHLPVPETEYRFYAERRWRFDMAWPADKLALEIEGGTWIAGAHNRGRHFESDAEKYNEATLQGWRVLRVTTDMVEDGRALAWIERALA